MKFANELKVGLALLVSVAIFVLGIRYLKDVPLFSGTHEYFTIVHNANGLIAGNPVRVSGVKVGSVADVSYDTDVDSIFVRFNVDRKIRVTSGSFAQVAGIDALGGVRLDVTLGPRENPVVPIGGFVRSATMTDDLLSQLGKRAPGLANRADSVLAGLDATLSATSALLNNPSSDLRMMMAALRGTATALESTIRAERESLHGVIENLESITVSVREVIDSQGDSLSIAADNLRRSMASLDEMMASLKTTTARLDVVAARIESGDGTLGRLVNDPGLYQRLDSVATNLNELIVDFKRRPRRYLSELKIVDIF